jgi:hypothetical protein
MSNTPFTKKEIQGGETRKETKKSKEEKCVPILLKRSIQDIHFDGDPGCRQRLKKN